MPVSVHDSRSNSNEQIVHAANIIGRSKRCYKVFEAIFRGKKIIKTVKDIEKITGLNNVEVLQQGKKLSSNGIVEQVKTKTGTGYKKDKFYSQHYRRILSIAGKKEKIGKIPTKRNSGNTINIINKASINKFVDIEQITVDDIDNFNKVKSINKKSVKIKSIYEKPFKEGIKKIIGETGKFTDWGGEKNDLFTTRLKINGKRYPCAFAFKGKGKTGILTPKKMGKNGDQVQRLFSSQANVFIVQYWDNIDESIIEQMKFFAQAKSAIEQKKIYYGIIDGIDTQRLIKAYSSNFSES
mgnify:CR=1 FL=1